MDGGAKKMNLNIEETSGNRYNIPNATQTVRNFNLSPFYMLNMVQ